MHDLFSTAQLPRYYVEHYPPMLYDERDLEAFDSVEEAEEFAEDCARGGENARIFGEMARVDAAGNDRNDASAATAYAEAYPDWLAA